VLFEDEHESLVRVAALGVDVQGLYPGRELDVAVMNHADPLFLKKIVERSYVTRSLQRMATR